MGTFTPDELATGQTSGATGYVVDLTTGVLRLVDVSGSFSNGENVVGGSSSAHGTISGITTLPIKQFAGDVLTVENRVAVARSASQAETVQLVLEF